MATEYKILGQVQAAAASAVQVLNLFPDPNMESFTSNTGGYTATGATTGVWQTYHDSHNPHTQTTYQSDTHQGPGVSGRTNSIRFSQHHTSQTPRWHLRPSTRPTLKNGQTYTLSLWYRYANDNNSYWHGGERSAHWVRYATDGSDNGNVSITETNGNGAESQQYFNNWKQHYTTFQGTGSQFNLSTYLHCNHSNVWQWIWLDNIYLTEGALPLALIPSKAPDGSSGNPNALHSVPFTTRSEGWESTPYLSQTVRRLTGSWQNLYMVPDLVNAAAVISTLTITNTGTSGATYRVAVQKAGESLSAKHLLAFDHPIAGNSLETLTLGLTIGRQDKVIVQSDSDKVSFALYGSELTQ
jgi:hypothetical protein